MDAHSKSNIVLPIGLCLILACMIGYVIYTKLKYPVNLSDNEKFTVNVVDGSMAIVGIVIVSILIFLGIKNKEHRENCVWFDVNFYWEILSVSVLPAIGHLYLLHRRSENNTINLAEFFIIILKFSILHILLEFSQYNKHNFSKLKKI